MAPAGLNFAWFGGDYGVDGVVSQGSGVSRSAARLNFGDCCSGIALPGTKCIAELRPGRFPPLFPNDSPGFSPLNHRFVFAAWENTALKCFSSSD